MSKNDDKIKKLMAAVEDKKKAMGPRPKVSFDTTALFKLPNGSSFNLNVVSDSKTLVELLAYLLEAQARIEEASEMLGLDTPDEFKHCGFKVSKWAGDFKQRLGAIKWDEEKKRLVALEQKLAKLISEDARTEIELADIEKMLSD